MPETQRIGEDEPCHTSQGVHEKRQAKPPSARRGALSGKQNERLEEQRNQPAKLTADETGGDSGRKEREHNGATHASGSMPPACARRNMPWPEMQNSKAAML